MAAGERGILIRLIVLTGAAVSMAAADPTTQPIVYLNQEQDHQRMLQLLHLTALRPGVDGMNPKAHNAANYDESKANPMPPLPDPLTLNDGNKVTTAEMWRNQRRPEIVELFDREIYGRVPAQTPNVNWEVLSTTPGKMGDYPVITRKLVGHVDNSAYPAIKVDIGLTLSTPADAKGPVPVMMEFGFVFPRRFAGATRPSAAMLAAMNGSGPPWQQQMLAKGWGYATIMTTSIQADNGAGLTQGIIGLCNKGQPRGLDDWGALRAWAWGASRALDYFETDPTVDAKKVGIWGHSRFGKAALVTEAYDPRFAIAYVSSSGEAGAKPYRRNWGEMVENIAASGEYHWMCGNFMKYAAAPLTAADLPIDSHELIALCAPRPVFVGGGVQPKGDGWVDSKGMFLSCVAASPVYELLGKKGIVGTSELPPVGTPLIDGDIGFRQQDGGHTPAPNWPTFIRFASKYF